MRFLIRMVGHHQLCNRLLKRQFCQTSPRIVSLVKLHLNMHLSVHRRQQHPHLEVCLDHQRSATHPKTLIKDDSNVVGVTSVSATTVTFLSTKRCTTALDVYKRNRFYFFTLQSDAVLLEPLHEHIHADMHLSHGLCVQAVSFCTIVNQLQVS